MKMGVVYLVEMKVCYVQITAYELISTTTTAIEADRLRLLLVKK